MSENKKKPSSAKDTKVKTNTEDSAKADKDKKKNDDQEILVSSLLALASEPGPSATTTTSDENVDNNAAIRAATFILPDKDKAVIKDNIYLCGECSAAFTSREDCTSHLATIHRERPRVPPPPPLPQPTAFLLRVAPVAPVAPNPRGAARRPIPILPKIDPNTAVTDLSSTSANKRPRRSALSSMKTETTNDSGDLKCPEQHCSYSFNTIEKLNTHKACHGVDMFACDQPDCNATFERWRHCSWHLWRNHGIDIDLITCKTFKAPTWSQMETHVETHQEERIYTCKACNKSYKQLSQLRNHAVTHLSKDADNVSIDKFKLSMAIFSYLFDFFRFLSGIERRLVSFVASISVIPSA